MKILLLGGTGAMGMHLVSLLKEQGNEVTVTSRSKRDDSDGIRYLQGNARSISFLREILKSPWDAVVDFMSYGTEEFRERVSLFLRSTKQYVFISSARVYSESEGAITEETPRLLDASTDKEYLKTDEYALAKARQENLLRESGQNNWTIIRPSITFGENRLQLGCLEKEGWIYRALRGRAIVFSEDIASKLTAMTYGWDVSRGISAIIGKPEAHGQAFHITSEEAFLWKDILDLYLNVWEKCLGFRPKVIMTKKSSNLKIGKYQVIYCRYFNRRFDNKKIGRFIDVSSFRKTEEGLTHCLETFLKDPSFLPINWKLEALNDRASGEWASWNEIPSLKLKLIYWVERLGLSFALSGLRVIRKIFR